MHLWPRSLALAWLALISLYGCSSNQGSAEFEQQKFYFLESLQQVESGGQQLKLEGLSQEALQQALATLDRGLELAFQVERGFLDKLDLRLGKNYQRYFIEGVENYRLGIEAGDQQQQREGLRLLQQWADFWNAESTAVQSALYPQ